MDMTVEAVEVRALSTYEDLLEENATAEVAMSSVVLLGQGPLGVGELKDAPHP